MRRLRYEEKELIAIWLSAIAVLATLAFWSQGCATAAGPVEPPLRIWAHEHARIVIANDAPACFTWAVVDALDVIRPRVSVTVERGFDNPPRPGEIVVRCKRPPGALGLTMAWIDSRYVYRATIDVPECRTRLLAHELGHAFGLANVKEPGRLMSTVYGDGWFALTVLEKAALRRQN